MLVFTQFMDLNGKTLVYAVILTGRFSMTYDFLDFKFVYINLYVCKFIYGSKLHDWRVKTMVLLKTLINNICTMNTPSW